MNGANDIERGPIYNEYEKHSSSAKRLNAHIVIRNDSCNVWTCSIVSGSEIENMASVQSTIEFLKSHGSVMYAAETAEGVIATSWEGDGYANPAAVADDDIWCEAVMVFPIIDGNVSKRDVRAWLGY